MRLRLASSKRHSTTASARPSCSRPSGRASRSAASALPTNVPAQFSTWFLRWPHTSPAKASTSTADSGLPEGRLHVKASEGRTGLLVSPQSSASEGLELEIIKLAPGDQEAGTAVGKETLLVVMGGRVDLELNGVRWNELGERANVFGGRATSAYLPPSTEYVVRSPAGAEVALFRAPAGLGGAPYVIGPDDVDVATRQARLQEVYHFRIDPPQGFGIQRIYSPERGLNEAFVVEDGDTVVIPFGYHPVVAAPGYRLYYLWALAGDGRDLRVVEDPVHGWVARQP